MMFWTPDPTTPENEMDFKVWEAEKANGIKSTSRWFQTNLIF
jgi:hypothetical protein